MTNNNAVRRTLGGASRTRSASGLWSFVNGLTSTGGRCFVSVMSSMFTMPPRATSHGSNDAYRSTSENRAHGSKQKKGTGSFNG